MLPRQIWNVKARPLSVRTECIIFINPADVRKTEIDDIDNLLHSGDHQLFEAYLCIWTLRHHMRFERHKSGLIRCDIGWLSGLHVEVSRSQEVGDSSNDEGGKKGMKSRCALGCGGCEVRLFAVQRKRRSSAILAIQYCSLFFHVEELLLLLDKICCMFDD